jgi:O-antigen/teichoic acid export membrane protein
MLANSRLKLNFTVLLIAQIYTQVLAAVSGIVLVRGLGPSEYGNYTLAVTGLNLAAVMTDAGLSAYLGREAARLENAAALSLWITAIKVRLVLAMVIGLLAFSLACLWPPLGPPILVALADIALLPMSIIILTTALLNAQGQTPRSAGLNALIATLNFILLLVSLVWQPLAATALEVNLISSLIGAWLLAQPLFVQLKKFKTKAGFAWQPVDLLKASLSFWLIGLAAVLFQYSDIYLVSVLLGKEAVGQYGAAQRLLVVMTTIPTVWGVVAVPRFAREPLRWQAELKRWHLGLVGGGLVLALLSLVLARPLVSFLLGPKYLVAAEVLTWLVWAGVGIFASAAPVTWLTVTNRQHLILVTMLLANLADVLLVILLAGLLQWGLVGIAVARIGASWLVCVLYIFLGKLNLASSPK